MTRSTPARLYQERSMSTISPPAGRCGTYRWKYQRVLSRALGVGSATMRVTRGFMYSDTRLIVEPLPAASRPSKITTTRAPVCCTHACMSTSSACSDMSSRSYSAFGIRFVIGHLLAIEAYDVGPSLRQARTGSHEHGHQPHE